MRLIVKLTGHVVERSKARVLQRDVHSSHKIFRVFEMPAQAVRKGKAGNPTEFGKVVIIQAAENQLIRLRGMYRGPCLIGSIVGTLFGRQPELATVDGGFASAVEERQAQLIGVKSFVLARSDRTKDGSARAAQRLHWRELSRQWRPGCEGLVRSAVPAETPGQKHRSRPLPVISVCSEMQIAFNSQSARQTWRGRLVHIPE
jgi:hypothetical protein